jgi:hypothetical protein
MRYTIFILRIIWFLIKLSILVTKLDKKIRDQNIYLYFFLIKNYEIFTLQIKDKYYI